MNSVMEIGDNIVLLKDGHLVWQGDKSQVLTRGNTEIQEFIFASPFLQRLKEGALTDQK